MHGENKNKIFKLRKKRIRQNDFSTVKTPIKTSWQRTKVSTRHNTKKRDKVKKKRD